MLQLRIGNCCFVIVVVFVVVVVIIVVVIVVVVVVVVTRSFSNTNSASNLSSMRPPTPPHGAPPLPVVSLENSVHEQSAPAGVLAQRPEVKVTGVLGNNSSPVSTSLAAPSNGVDGR